MQTDNKAQTEEFKIHSENFPLLSMETLIARSEIPSQHKLIAQNYMVIKRIYGASSVPCKITRTEEAFLKECGLKTIENISASSMQEELNALRKLAASGEEELALKSDRIFAIRVKELKYLYASNYFPPAGEIYDGWRFLERYIEYIAR